MRVCHKMKFFKKFNRAHFYRIFLLFMNAGVCFFLPGNVFAQSSGSWADKKSISCIYPLETGMTWNYDIIVGGIKKGELFVKVESKGSKKGKHVRFDDTNVSLDEFTLSFKDTYRNKTYDKKIIRDYNSLHLYDANKKKYYPFLKTYLMQNDRFGNLIAMEIKKVIFKGKENETITLLDVDNPDYMEMYMKKVGLYYYRNGDLEYKLNADNSFDLLNEASCEF